MAKTRVGINGFGRIGRQVLRALLDDYADRIEVAAINDPAGKEIMAHLFKYDSTYGAHPGNVEPTADGVAVNDHEIAVSGEFKIDAIPWAAHGVEIVIESTGKFTDGSQARRHIETGGVRKVIISAPAKNEDLTIVLGVNGGEYDEERHHVISNASCTTNCVAPMVKVLHDAFGVEQALMTTIHAFTNDQVVQDMAHKDLRRARAAAQSIIPTTTGAARAVTTVIPELQGRIDGMAFRVPVLTGSVTDLTVRLTKPASVDAVNAAYKDAAENAFSNILDYSETPLVSSDYIGNPYSCTIDGPLTAAIEDEFIKVVGWYDNEWGYSCRVADLTAMIANVGGADDDEADADDYEDGEGEDAANGAD